MRGLLSAILLLLVLAGCGQGEAEPPAEPAPAAAPEGGRYLVVTDDGRARVLRERPSEGELVDLGPPAPEPARTSVRITLEGAGRVALAVGGERREIQASGAIDDAALAPLFRGHAEWEAPVAAIIEAPPEARHATVIAILDALRSRGIDRVAVRMGEEGSGE